MRTGALMGPVPALMPVEVRDLLTWAGRGLSTPEIARRLGVSERTVRRYRHYSLETRVVGDWRLTFLMRPGSEPPAILERLHIR